VRRALEGLKGVKKAEVSFSEKQAVVTYDPQQASVDDMIQAVKRAGFQASETTGR
jgi:copper chaperone CopZ